LSKTGFLSHDVGYRYASKSIKGSLDVDFGLIFKTTLSQKMAQWVGAQSQVNLAKNAKTCPHCDVTSKKPISKAKKIFSISTGGLAESVAGLNSSLAPAAGDLWPKKCRPICRPARLLKG